MNRFGLLIRAGLSAALVAAWLNGARISAAFSKSPGGESVFIPAGTLVLDRIDPTREKGQVSVPYRLRKMEQGKRKGWEILLDLKAFRIGRFETTNRAYGEYLSATDRPTPFFWEDPRFNSPRRPVVGISWEEARSYCRWKGGRLPAEAEWMKAGQGEETRRTPWGGVLARDERSRVNMNIVVLLYLDYYGSRYELDGHRFTAPVGSFPLGATSSGVHDLLGNVWEWVNAPLPDRFSGDAGPGRPDDLRTQKGGSWITLPLSINLMTRRWRPQTIRHDSTVGFRCAWDP